MVPVCQRVSSEVGLGAIDPMDLERVGQGLIVHPGMLANPRVIAALLNRLSRGERQIYGPAQVGRV